MQEIPQFLYKKLQSQYGEELTKKIANGYSKQRYATLRANTIKTEANNVAKELQKAGIEFDKVNWSDNAFIIKNATESDIRNLSMYKNGEIYMQSLSSMIPAIILSPNAGENILDMTAAPGSKTTEMAALMENDGEILANELDKIRCERLKYNVQMQGADIVTVINRRGEKLGDEYVEAFDKVLLDAPCSGEGRFVATKVQTYRGWSEKTVNDLVKLQKKLFESAYKALKHGGVMVYSTCTINRYENEKLLDWALENFDIQIKNVGLEIKDVIPGDNTGINKDVNKAIKILPSKSMEGFFVSLIYKN